jgi:molecular chaperone Hsp33
VRGYVQRPQARVAFTGDGLGLSAAIGLGTLSIERMHPSWSQPYSGIVPIVSGEIAADLGLYLLESEQKPSAVALGIYLGPATDGGATPDIEAAVGYLVQALPGAAEGTLEEFERRINATLNPSELVRAGASADDVLERLLEGQGHGAIERVEPCFRCSCSSRKVLQAATLLGRDEIREMVAVGEAVEVRCAFCAEVYRMSPDAVASALPDA